MAKKHDAGKWAEKQAQDWLDARSAKTISCTYHRYPDARAARGALAAQPADYLVADTFIAHLEVKETREVKRLPKAKIGQYGTLKRFWWAKIAPIVLIHRSTLGDWVYLGANELFSFETCPPSFRIDDRPSFDTAADALNHIFAP